jgi:hypothetical protein
VATFLGSIVTTSAHQVILWSAVLAAAVIVLCLGVWYYRKYWLADGKAADEVWNLDDLRQMRDDDLLTGEEYQKLRSLLIGTFANRKNSGGGKAAASTPRDREPRLARRLDANPPATPLPSGHPPEGPTVEDEVETSGADEPRDFDLKNRPAG